ncbi:hypothetical protein GQ53DRAFT_746039 [Thozetella sp. PMI_491]|nr:hypothetical protein GQ53DRAFT_746039 [Thozetella sp. PMI_491]
MGFMPLSGNAASGDTEIPLSTVRSNASSGSRKPNQTTFQAVDMGENGDSEKRGLFKRKGGSGPAGRRRVQKDLSRAGTGGSESIELNAMGKFYNKIINFSVVTRYLVYVVPVAAALAVPLIVLPITGPPFNADTNPSPKDRITVGDIKDENGNVTQKGPSLFMLFLWIEIAWLSLWVGKVVAHLLPPIFMFFCGVVSSGTRKYAAVLGALEIPLSFFFWGLASWLTFKFFFTNDAFQWVDTIKRILLSLFLASAVLLVEKTIVQLISISYHQRSFANRIKDSKREVHLLGLLYDASRTLFPMYCPEFMEEDYVINDSLDMILSGGKRGHRRNGSVTPMRLIGDVGRFGDKLTSVFGNIASEITGKQVFNPNSAHSVVVEALEKLRSSEALARRIWMSFVVEGSDSLSVDDIIEVLGPAHKEDAEECFAAIDADGNGDIELDEMIRKVVDIGKERKAIANSMKDIGQALRVFDEILLFVVLIIVVIIFLAVFQSSFIATLTTAGTTLLSLSFVFAVTTQEFLGSCIFLFVKHPYDVGDRVDITGPEKEQLIVEKISLLFTVFTRIDKNQVVQVPNITLNNLWIENVTRSKAMKEVLDINVAFDTTFEDIELLRLEMEKFVRAPENSRDFQPDVGIGIGGVGDLDKLNLKIAIKHKSNWHNDGVRATRRSKFICGLTLAMKRVPIHAPGGGGEALGGPTNPSYSVAVSDDWASNTRSKVDTDKKAAKLSNQTGGNEPSRKQSSATLRAEEAAADELNTRNPLADAVDDWGYDSPLSAQPSVGRGSSGRNLASNQSQRGRRKAGDTLPPMPTADMPAVQVTRTSSSARNQSFDVERQAGGGYNPYTVFPTEQAYPTAYQGGVGPDGTHPLQSAPTVPTSGNRPRGASVSRSQAQGQPQYPGQNQYQGGRS